MLAGVTTPSRFISARFSISVPSPARRCWRVIIMSAGIGLSLLKPWPFKYIVDGLLSGDASHGSADGEGSLSQRGSDGPMRRVPCSPSVGRWW